MLNEERVHMAHESKGAKIRNRYNQVLHLTRDTNGKVTNSQLDTTNESFTYKIKTMHSKRAVRTHLIIKDCTIYI